MKACQNWGLLILNSEGYENLDIKESFRRAFFYMKECIQILIKLEFFIILVHHSVPKHIRLMQ